MKSIGGNLTAAIQVYKTTKNAIGENVQDWVTVQSCKGWLDLQAGEAKFTSFNAKIQESTHVFVGKYIRLNEQITAENSRMLINGKRYDVLLIDDPMEMHQQIEIYLKYTGGQ